jgi:hypothetical protein
VASRNFIAIACLLSACDGSTVRQTGGFIGPMDGQTHVSKDQALLVSTGGLDLPAKYAIPQSFIRVVNLVDGGFVAGDVVREGDDILFLPERSWKANTRYAWSTNQIPALPRSPEYQFPKALIGEAVFDTSSTMDVLDVVLDDTRDEVGQPCALLSREIVAPNALVVLTLNGELLDDVDYDIYDEGEWGASFDADYAPSVSVVCFDIVVSPGDSLRLWWNESGPWVTTIERGQIESALRARHRGGS